MKRTKDFCPSNRYAYDFGLCSTTNGFAQIDTRDDAEYFGQWANPERLIIFAYIEGDCILTECDTVEEFKEQINAIKIFYGDDFKGIDPGLDEKNIQAWKTAGLSQLLH